MLNLYNKLSKDSSIMPCWNCNGNHHSDYCPSSRNDSNFSSNSARWQVQNSYDMWSKYDNAWYGNKNGGRPGGGDYSYPKGYKS